MLAVRLEDELDSQLELLARAKQSTKSNLVREAILRMLEDEEDLVLAARAQAQTRSSKSIKRLRKELGLDR